MIVTLCNPPDGFSGKDYLACRRVAGSIVYHILQPYMKDSFVIRNRNTLDNKILCGVCGKIKGRDRTFKRDIKSKRLNVAMDPHYLEDVVFG